MYVSITFERKFDCSWRVVVYFKWEVTVAWKLFQLSVADITECGTVFCRLF